ncbi:hypothetical protein BU23DRAFT_559638 [Bimuria novae-zelandiae CBS 107.79]|uniref:Small ribosomal subunit protein mS35 mitochondrial conserved domain-containing protein n=1 Tax=Bimuria novae-zelandiae CBS 107.79 TaxID=1447943 RepID=A0A6A5UQC8_9PLEO|nr:hypothetical protein BU23DRAFT_559638 [Bimuria novae-zelandiae CBS 107.79]
MASISRCYVLLSRRCPLRPPSPYVAPKYTPQWQRPFSTTPSRAAGGSEDAFTPGKPPQTEGAAALRSLVEDLKALDPDVIEDAIRKGRDGIAWTNTDTNEIDNDEWAIQEEDTRRVGFWGEGEESLGKDEDYYGDDLTSLGHGELEQHRELREYARLIAWELPLLHQLARPFELPTAATPFRFRYTSYLSESHPAINKVVVEFSPSDMPNLSPAQRAKLIKLAGVRYNPSSDIIKMSCEQFDTQAQNKRFLGETIAALLKEAEHGKDLFEDVPFDFRHHKPKVRHEFPKEWILTEERKKYLEEKRAQTLQLEERKANNEGLVDGKLIVETSLPARMPEPDMAMVGGPRGGRL